IDKTFDYAVPDRVDGDVQVGTIVRVPLHGRRVGGWVVADSVDPPAGVQVRDLAKVTGWGPAPEIIDLARWAAWRWAGRTASLLRTASPPRAVRALPAAPRRDVPLGGVDDELLADAFARGRAVLRLPPAADLFPVALAAARRGNAL